MIAALLHTCCWPGVSFRVRTGFRLLIASLFKSLAQINDPRFRRVWLKGFVYSILLFVLIVGASSLALSQMNAVGIAWIDWVITGLGSIGAFILALIFFPGLALTVIGLLLEEVCRAVEARHYPGLPSPRPQSWGELIGGVARLAALTLLLNIAVLPLYFVPFLNVLVFYVLNGILLSREYYELVSLRRVDLPQAVSIRQRHRPRLFADGVIITLLLSIPFIGWTMAVIATAMMVHEFETLTKKQIQPAG